MWNQIYHHSAKPRAGSSAAPKVSAAAPTISASHSLSVSSVHSQQGPASLGTESVVANAAQGSGAAERKSGGYNIWSMASKGPPPVQEPHKVSLWSKLAKGRNKNKDNREDALVADPLTIVTGSNDANATDSPIAPSLH
jgi:hypothetical protein